MLLSFCVVFNVFSQVILCSGLYPQLAVSDEFNSFKRDTEQTFHTKNKGFVLLHPTSVFATDTSVLQPVPVKEHDNITKETKLKGCISNNHQLLAFVYVHIFIVY